MDVSVKLIKSFLTVAELGSVSAAARSLNYSQPSISLHIQALERQLGYTLFERRGRRLQLTTLGTLAIDCLKGYLTAVESLEHDLQHLCEHSREDGAYGQLRRRNYLLQAQVRFLVAHCLLVVYDAKQRGYVLRTNSSTERLDRAGQR